MSLLLVLFWSSLVVKVSSNYHVVEDAPVMPCTLATPKIEFGELHDKVILDKNLLDPGQKARVGYVVDFVELQYIGCIQLRDISATQHISVSTPIRVDDCYSACDDHYTVIGLTSRKEGGACLCFGDDILKVSKALGNWCSRCGSFACGSSEHVSLYERVKTGVRGGTSTRSNSCLSKVGITYNWLKCNTRLDGIACATDNDGTITQFLSPGWLSRDWTWVTGVSECLGVGAYPMPYRESRNESWDEHYWTGVVKTVAIRKEVEDSHPAYGFGYVKKADGEYVLKFYTRSDLTSRSICINETISSTTDKPGASQKPGSSSTSPSTSIDVGTTSPLRGTQTSTFTTLTHENTSITDTSAEDHITTTTTKITTAMSTENKHITESMGSPYGDKTEEESSVGLSIGLPVAALLLVGIGVVVFVLWKRRRKPLKEKETPSSLQNNVIYQNNNAMIAHTNNAYEEVDQPSDVLNDQANVYDLCKDEDKDSQHEYGNSYFVLEKAKEGTEYSEVSKAREKKPEYSEVSKAHDNKTESNDNAYFVLEKEEKTPDPDDTGYGSSNSGNLKSKGASNVPDRHVYSTAGSANTVNNPYDEYDHIGRTSGRALTESNLYDSTFANKPTDTTYDSTLLNTSAKRNKTDAIYDKANNAANNVYANIGDN